MVIALLNDRPTQVRTRFDSCVAERTTMLVPTMVLFELWFGIAKSTRRAVNAERLVLFLHGGLDLLPFDADDARAAGEIRVVLEARGTPIGPYDLLIAAQALRRGATLVTSNLREFERVDGLKLVDWASPSLS